MNPHKEINTTKIESKDLKERKSVKLLGITLGNNITMDTHIRNICKKAGAKLSALARIAKFSCEQKRIILMRSFITSQFNYCPIIWMYCKRESNHLINRIHERALRIAYNDYISDFKNLLIKDKSFTIHHKNIQQLCNEIYKTMVKVNPKFMNEVFKTKQCLQNTRRQTLTYPNPQTVIYGVDSFGYKASQFWSKIPSNIQNADMQGFKLFINEQCSKICKCNLCKIFIKDLGFI